MLSSKTPPPRQDGRRFGTLISHNSVSPRKKVKAKLSHRKAPRRDHHHLPDYVSYSVVFSPGPIGLELDEDNHSIIRVQKFVDGGHQNPGAARKSGLIHPGDEVIAVNGKTVTSYEQTLELLQEQTTTREMTFRRPFDQLLPKATPNTTGRMGRTIQITPNAALVSLRAVESEPRRITIENKEADNLLSPAHVKALPQHSQLVFDEDKQAALQKIVATLAGVVPKTNYGSGLVLGSTVESSLVAETNKELRSTFEQKYALLQELSQAKVALHQQKEFIDQQSHTAHAERQRMEEDLMISRREKYMAEASLISYRENLQKQQVDEAEKWKLAFEDICAQNEQMKQQLDELQGVATQSEGRVFDGPTSDKRVLTIEQSKLQELEASESLLRRDVEIYQARLEASERQLLQMDEKIEDQETRHDREVLRLKDLLSSKLRAFDEERSRIALEKQSMQVNHEAEKRRSSEDKEMIKKNLHDLVTSVRGERENAEANLLSRTQILENELEAKTSLLEKREAELGHLKEYVQKTEQTIHDLQKNLEKSEAEKGQQQASLNSLHREVMNLRDLSSTNQEKYQLELNDLSEKTKKQNEIIISQAEETSGTARRLHDTENVLNDTIKLKSVSEEKLQAALNKVMHLEKELDSWPPRESLIRKQEEERFKVNLEKVKTVYEASLMEARSEIAEITQKCHSLESSKSFSQQEIESLRRAKEDLSDQVSELRKNLDDTEAQLSEKRMEVFEREGELQDVQDALIRAQQELNSCKSSLDAAHLQYSDLSAHFSQTNEAFNSVREELSSEIVDLSEQCSSLHSQKASMENILRSIRKSASESEARCSRMRQELQREHEELLSQKRMSEQKIAQSQEDFSVSEKKNSDLAEELSVFKKQLSVLTVEKNTLRNEVESLRRLYTHAENTLESSRAAHSAECRNLEFNLETEKEKRKASSEALNLSKLEISSLQQELKGLNELLSEQKQKYEADAETMSRKHVELYLEKDNELQKLRASAKDTGKLRRNLQEQEDRLACALSDVKQLEHSVEKLKCDLTQKTSWAESREAEARRLKAEMAECEAKLKSDAEQLETFQCEFQKRSLEISTVKRERDQLIADKVKLLKSLREAEDDLSQLNQELQIARMERNDLSTDSSSDDFSGLPRDELKKMCVSFQEDMKVLERRASDAIENSTRRQNQVERLVDDVGSLSAEVEKLVEANDKLNEHLHKVKSETSDALVFKRSFEQKVECFEYEIETNRDELENQRRMNHSLSESLNGLRKQMQAEKQRHTVSAKQHEKDLNDLKHTLVETEKSKENEIARLSSEVLTLKEEIDLCLIKKRDTERILAAKNVEYDEFKKAQDSMVSALNQEISRHENRSASLKSECEVLCRRITELDMVEQLQKSQILKLRESETRKDIILAQCCEEIEEKKQECKALASDLSDIQRVSSDREMKIEQLERQLAESEVTISSLAEQLEKYQGTLKKIESSAETNGNFRSQEIQEIESRCSFLEEEHASLTQELSCLRGDLRKTRNDLHESERLNKSLKTRHDNMKTMMDSSKTQLLEARELKEEATMKAKKSETELENKQMELDHLRTQVKLLTSTISRMKADYAMLQESAVQNELKAAASVQAQAEISNLKAELRKNKLKLESVSAYQLTETAVVPDMFEEQLLQFIEDVIYEADSAFQDILRHSNIVCDSSSGKAVKSEELTALDLATNSTRQTKLENVRDSMDSLSLIIPKAISYLNEKLGLLQEWKRHRKSRSEAKTPNRENVVDNQVSSPILKTLEKMKAVITEDLLSPCKYESTYTNRPDPDILQNVIFSLEEQIDSLLSDLKAANDALRAKEQLFADLEDLVHHHETERDILERKLESMSSRLYEGGGSCENFSQRQGEGEASVDGNDEVSTTPKDENTQKLAIQLACKVMNGERQLKTALAFQHWSTFTTTSRDMSIHSEAATALVHELETTREKLVILKKHLKKSRRGREPTLDRIIEGYVVDSS